MRTISGLSIILQCIGSVGVLAQDSPDTSRTLSLEHSSVVYANTRAIRIVEATPGAADVYLARTVQLCNEVDVLDVRSETLIDCPRETVAAYASDPSNAPEWYVNIRSVEWLTAPPMTVGTKVRFRAMFLGRRLSYTYEVVEYRPDHRLVMRTSEGPFPMETTYEWSDHREGTRMTLRNRGNPAGFSKLLAPFMARGVRAANRKDLVRLKYIVEAEC